MQPAVMENLLTILGLLASTLGLAPAEDPELLKGSRTYTLAEMDDFAAEILGDLQKPSFAENREFCGLFVTQDGVTLMATKATPGRSHSCSIPYPAADSGLTMVASYHTHAGDDPMADGEVPSTVDLESDMADGIPGYVATPGGRLWRTDPRLRVVELICAKGCVSRDPRYVDCTRRAVRPRFTLSQLRLRAQSLDGTCDISR